MFMKSSTIHFCEEKKIKIEKNRKIDLSNTTTLSKLELSLNELDNALTKHFHWQLDNDSQLSLTRNHGWKSLTL